jgi:hypothetical protein
MSNFSNIKTDFIVSTLSGLAINIRSNRSFWKSQSSTSAYISELSRKSKPTNVNDPDYPEKLRSWFVEAHENVLSSEKSNFGTRAHSTYRQEAFSAFGSPSVLNINNECSIVFVLMLICMPISHGQSNRNFVNSLASLHTPVPTLLISLLNSIRRSFLPVAFLEPDYIDLSEHDLNILGLSGLFLFDPTVRNTQHGISLIFSLFSFLRSQNTYIEFISFTAPINYVSSSTVTFNSLSCQRLDSSFMVTNTINQFNETDSQVWVTFNPINSYGGNVLSVDVFLATLFNTVTLNASGDILNFTDFSPSITVSQNKFDTSNTLVKLFVAKGNVRPRNQMFHPVVNENSRKVDSQKVVSIPKITNKSESVVSTNLDQSKSIFSKMAKPFLRYLKECDVSFDEFTSILKHLSQSSDSELLVNSLKST